MKRRAFLIEPVDGNFDMSALEEDYDIHYIFANVNSRPKIYHPNEFIEAVQKWGKENFLPEQGDYFVMTGRVLPLSFTVLALGLLFESLPLLVYDGSIEGYSRRNVQCPTGEEDLSAQK